MRSRAERRSSSCDNCGGARSVSSYNDSSRGHYLSAAVAHSQAAQVRMQCSSNTAGNAAAPVAQVAMAHITAAAVVAVK